MMHERQPSHDSPRAFVFVYGTLRSGEINDINRLTPAPRRVGMATLRGLLYDLGAYPGMVPESSLGADDPMRARCVEVVGEVYEIDPSLEPVLDEIEEVFPQRSGEYRRRHGDVAVDARRQRVLFYEVAPERVQGRALISGGDWVAHRKSRAAAQD